jgi:hypothetical protein
MAATRRVSLCASRKPPPPYPDDGFFLCDPLNLGGVCADLFLLGI